MKEHVKILLLGDEGVGKSSLLSAYMSKHFPQEVPPVVIDTTIPAEKTANGVCVTIMDSSARDREQLRQKILAADSIVALYDVTRPETYDNLLTDWLPFVKEVLSIPDINFPSLSLSGTGSNMSVGVGPGSSTPTAALMSKAKGPTSMEASTPPPAVSTSTNNLQRLGNKSNNTSMNKLNALNTSGGGGGGGSSMNVSGVAASTVSSSSGSSSSSSSSAINNQQQQQRNKPVIVLGTKTDLLVANNNSMNATISSNEDEEVEKIHHLFEHFPFVLLSLRCSAAKLEDVEQLFYFAELVVTFPLHPIFDVISHEYTPACRYAFQRIFRIFDLDGDNLLSDSELCESQLKCFDLAINHEELLAIKRQISKMVAGGIYEDKVTFEGYLGLIQMIIENHQFQIPWTILRRFNYNEDLMLQIPQEILTPPFMKEDQITELSDQAKEFLVNLAKIAYLENTKPMKADSDSCSEMEDCLTWEALKTILCVLPPGSSHPWSSPPNYKSLWPRNNDPLHPIEQSILLTGMPHSGATISFDCWLMHWNQLAVSDPVLVQKLLFELGYAERQDLGIIVTMSTIENLHKQFIQQRMLSMSWFHQLSSYFFHRQQPVPGSLNKSSATTALMKGQKKTLTTSMLYQNQNQQSASCRSTIHIAIMGDNRVGKSTFVWNMSSLRPPGFDEEDIEKGVDYAKPLENIVIGGCSQSKSLSQYASSSSGSATDGSSSATVSGLNTGGGGTSSMASLSAYDAPYVHKQYDLCFAAIPLDHVKKWNEVSIHRCDLVILMFQCGDMESVETVLQLEKELPLRIPRIFIGTKADLLYNQSYSSGFIDPNSHQASMAIGMQHMKELRQTHEMVLQTIALHLQEEELPPVILTSSSTNTGVPETLDLVRAIIHDPTIAIPVKSKKIKTTNYQTPIIIVSSVVGVVSLSYLAIKYNQEMRHALHNAVDSAKGWLSHWGVSGLKMPDVVQSWGNLLSFHTNK